MAKQTFRKMPQSPGLKGEQLEASLAAAFSRPILQSHSGHPDAAAAKLTPALENRLFP